MFNEDINRLLAMDDMWKVPGRIRPVPLDYDGIMSGSFVMPPSRTSATEASESGTGKDGNKQSAGGPLPVKGSIRAKGAGGANGLANGHSSMLKDQKELSLKENLVLFVDG